MNNKIRSYFKENFQELQQFLKSTDLSKAVLLGVAIALPIITGIWLDYFEIGLAMALGALLSSPSDVSGSVRHKKYGILLSAILAVLASLAGGYLPFHNLLWLPLLGLIFFFISYLSVFGFRASLISFSGLFALVLSFANISEVLEIYERALLVGVGGLWYLFLALLLNRINPKGQTDQFLSEAFVLTASYLEVRGQLFTANEKREELFRKLLELQTELNEKHETLREILISSRRASGSSNYERRRLLILIQLVDILELAMANPVNYEKMDLLVRKHPGEIHSFQALIFKMSARIFQLSDAVDHHRNPSADRRMENELNNIKSVLHNHEFNDEDYLILQNLYDYQESQVQNIKKIEQILLNADIRELRLMRNDEAARFLKPQEYNPKMLVENFSFKSTIFKHSLRLAVVVMIGFAVGSFFSLQNSYWILLTIIVIMRPNYGLTKSRSKQRTIGTLIGAAIAIGIVLITQNVMVYAVLSFLSLVMAFAMLQKNYKTSAVFVTLSVVFVYALLQPNVLNVIRFRVIDTLLGAGLATLGNIFLWPSWEFLGISPIIAESIKANREYFREIMKLYEKKGKMDTSYKLSRKQAFLAMGNLSAAFQRMTQEPKSRQKNLDKVYQMVTLNHSFLAALASMGTYIQNHSTTEASVQFKTYTRQIEENLEKAMASLEQISYEAKPEFLLKAEEELFIKRIRDIRKNNVEIEPYSLQEAQLFLEQLKWTMEISRKLGRTISETEFS